MCDFSPAELAVIGIALDEEERKQSRKRKRVWVHPILQDRKVKENFTRCFLILLMTKANSMAILE